MRAINTKSGSSFYDKGCLFIQTKSLLSAYRSLFVLAALAMGFLLDSYASGNSVDPYGDISLPVYKDAKDIRQYVNEQGCVKSTTYTINVDYPPHEVINFYDKMMSEYNFTPNAKGVNSKGWMEFEDRSGEAIRYVRQFFKTWISKDKNKEIIVSMEYQAAGQYNWTDELIVTVQILPVYDTDEIDRFLSRINQEGKLEEFMELLDRYSTQDLKVDFDTAIRENTNNPYLRRYKELVADSLEKAKERGGGCP